AAVALPRAQEHTWGWPRLQPLRRRPSLGCAAAEQVRERLAVGRESQGRRIQAVALAGWRRTVGKDMAEMAAAARADFLDAHHAVAEVAHVADVRRIEGGGETRPAGA